MSAASKNSFNTRSTLKVGNESFEIYSLEPLKRSGVGKISSLPFSMKILLENLLRQEDGQFVHADDIRALANWQPAAEPSKEISFLPARVLLQDFTGVPAVVDLAAMREAMRKLGGDPRKINPLFPAELVIDHSVQVDQFGTAQSFAFNSELEFMR
ncbi:MAG: aconitase family protein, partial [Candidatus Acidiferrales bacterium]